MFKKTLSLQQYGITQTAYHNLSPAALYQLALAQEAQTMLASSGALVAYSGAKTGRSPKDKRIVFHQHSAANIDWGEVNIALDEQAYLANRAVAMAHLNNAKNLYVFDGFASWDTQYRLKIRVISTRAYHALFMHNMLIRPTAEELAEFGQADYVLFNAGEFPADTRIKGINTSTSIALSFEKGEMIILGTEYAGEMKKGVFTIMNYLMPLKGQLPMHCSATVERNGKASTILFGLSGTGKTTLSADPKRELIGDDEHVWTDNGIFNIEGGCYAKVIDLSAEKEPDIYRAIRFGSVLENVVLNDAHQPDYQNACITENTRASYPIEFIENARIPCVAGQPSNLIFLTCDAFGVLPPVAKLSPEQAMYHFISGYTAKVAGTEMGIDAPQAVFSTCFGAPFMVWSPSKYAQLLLEKIQAHQTDVWLVNTGWIGGAYGVGQRIKLSYSRAIVDAINQGALKTAPSVIDPRFGFAVITECPNVPADILQPQNAWADKRAYAAQANQLVKLFEQNFARYQDNPEYAQLREIAAPKWVE